jgi:NADPH-dependent 2,4-dienoyl-CoA reductase/sulfur reductase-like enzyme
MVARNDITGDKIQTRDVLSKEGEAAFDRIFGVKKKEKYVPPPLPDWGDEESERRMDIIGSNGPIGYGTTDQES